MVDYPKINYGSGYRPLASWWWTCPETHFTLPFYKHYVQLQTGFRIRSGFLVQVRARCSFLSSGGSDVACRTYLDLIYWSKHKHISQLKFALFPNQRHHLYWMAYDWSSCSLETLAYLPSPIEPTMYVRESFTTYVRYPSSSDDCYLISVENAYVVHIYQ